MPRPDRQLLPTSRFISTRSMSSAVSSRSAWSVTVAKLSQDSIAKMLE